MARRKQRRKSRSKINWSLVTLILGVLVIALLFYGGSQGWFTKISNTYFGGSGSGSGSDIQISGNNNQVDPAARISLNINPSNICIGNQTTGQISSNMYNAQCMIWYKVNSGNWQEYRSVNLDNFGIYYETVTINAAGTATFKVVCYKNGYYAISPEATLTVTNCANPGPGPGPGPSSDSDNDGYSNEEEQEAGTDPNDSTSYPGSSSESCRLLCQGALYPVPPVPPAVMNYSYRGPVTSPGYCNSPEISIPLPGSTDYCCCDKHRQCEDDDGGSNIFVRGTCTNINGGVVYDYCETNQIGSKYLKEYTCGSDGYCIATSITCPYMQDACSNGACWQLV